MNSHDSRIHKKKKNLKVKIAIFGNFRLVETLSFSNLTCAYKINSCNQLYHLKLKNKQDFVTYFLTDPVCLTRFSEKFESATVFHYNNNTQVPILVKNHGMIMTVNKYGPGWTFIFMFV
jgi:hypothetical protein